MRIPLIAIPIIGLACAAITLDEVPERLGIARSRFQIGDRLILRPKAFRFSRDHRAAFAIIGERLERLSRDGAFLTEFSDSEILACERYRRFSLRAWHDVLDFFVGEGLLTRSWRLVLPNGQDGVHVPNWAADGGPVPGLDHVPTNRDPLQGELPFWPGRLDYAVKLGMVGQPYAIAKGYGSHRIMLTEQHFEAVYDLERAAGEW